MPQNEPFETEAAYLMPGDYVAFQVLPSGARVWWQVNRIEIGPCVEPDRFRGNVKLFIDGFDMPYFLRAEQKMWARSAPHVNKEWIES